MGSHGTRSWVAIANAAHVLTERLDAFVAADNGLSLDELRVERQALRDALDGVPTPAPGTSPAAGPDGRCPAQQALVEALDEACDHDPRAMRPRSVDLRAALEARGYTITPRAGTVGGRSAVPTRDEMIDALNQSIVEQGYGDTDIDPGDLLEALLGITGVLPVAPTREQVREAIAGASPREGAKHTLGDLYNDTVLDNATDAVMALPWRSAGEPPDAVAIVRQLAAASINAATTVDLTEAREAARRWVAAEPNEGGDG